MNIDVNVMKTPALVLQQKNHMPASNPVFSGQTKADQFTRTQAPQNTDVRAFAGIQKALAKMALATSAMLPFAAAPAMMLTSPTAAMAEITPASGKLVKALESKDDELIAAALVNLAAANERDAIPHVQRILSEAKNSEYTLSSALKALGQLGSNGTPDEKRTFSKAIQPYLFKVIVEDKEKHPRFMTLSDAKSELSEHPEYKIKDMRMAAARALGQNGDAVSLGQMVRAAKDMNIPTSDRLLALEALNHAPANRTQDKELLDYLNTLRPETEPDLSTKLATVLLRHDVGDVLPYVQKILDGTTNSATPAPPPKAAPAEKKDASVDNAKMTFIFSSGSTGAQPSAPQKAIIDTLLALKKPDTAPIILKQMAAFPEYFKENAFVPTTDFFREMPDATKDELVKLMTISNSEKAVRNALPKKTGLTPDAEKKENAGIQDNTKSLQKLAISTTAGIYYTKAAPAFREIYSDTTQNQNLRSMAIAGSAMIKDKGAVPSLMDVAVDNSDNVDVRYDAISAVMDIFQPPLSNTIITDSNKMKALEQYNTIFSGREKFTQSFYKAQMFSEIRDLRKALIKANAPAKTIDEATMKVALKYLQTGANRQQWQQLSTTPDFKNYKSKMIDYISKERNVDGFLRTQMIRALGETGTSEIKDTLKDLIRDPLARTQIPDLASSNDMFMFPGYTKMKVGEATRLVAIEALGKVGDINDAEILERGLKSDDRRTHFYSIRSLGSLGLKTQDSKDADVQKARDEVAGRLMKAMPGLDLEGSDRLNSFFKRLYAESADKLGAGEKLLTLMDESKDTILKRSIAHGLIYNDKYLDNPKVSRFLVAQAMGLADLQKKGIDGKGTEIAIIDGDYINDDVEGMKGKVEYPSWGRLKDAALRESFHDEAVASAIVGRRANVVYGIAPGVDKIHSYAAWDDMVSPAKGTPLEERDGMLRSLDDIITKRISGKSKVSVVNMSLGGTSALLYGDETTVKEYLNKLSARFKAGSEAGITFVISAGNERGEEFRHHLVGTLNSLGFGKENGKLAQSKGVILVAATDTRGTDDRSKHKLSWFTSMGDPFNATYPDIAAPGTNIPLVSREANGDVRIDEMDGTSFSAPITAGVLLLMNQVAGKTLETEQIRQQLNKTAYPISNVPDFMKGRPGGLDAPRVLEEARQLRARAEAVDLIDRFRTFMQSNRELLPARPPEIIPPSK